MIEFNERGKLERIDKEANRTKQTDIIYCVLEYAPGGDLFDYIFAVGSGFPENIARFYFKQLFSALEFLHDNKVVHRDMKLENLLLDKDFNLKLADFGLSTSIESELDSGIMYTRVGTERYMPPEMIEREMYIGT
jgi:serine/threonine protein kinase